MVAQASESSTRKMETGSSGVQGQPRLPRKLEACLDLTKRSPTTTKQEQTQEKTLEYSGPPL